MLRRRSKVAWAHWSKMIMQYQVIQLDDASHYLKQLKKFGDFLS